MDATTVILLVIAIVPWLIDPVINYRKLKRENEHLHKVLEHLGFDR